MNLIRPWLMSTLRTAVFASLISPEHAFVPMELGAPDIDRPEGLLKVRGVGEAVG